MTTARAFVAMLALAALGATAAWRIAAQREQRPAAPRPGATLPAEARMTVLAGHALTLGLGAELAVGTGFEFAAAWPAGLGWAEQAEWARGAPAEWARRVGAATAVATVRTAARDEALYAAVRAVQPRIVELDAGAAEDRRAPAVRVRPGAEPTGTAWALSLENAGRAAARLAADLTALRPADAATVKENLRRVQERLFRLRARAEAALARAEAPEVIGFSAEAEALLEEAGVRIAARLAPEPGRWSEADLRRAGARVSVHAYAPDPALAAALAAAGVRPVVLDLLSAAPGAAGDYFSAMEGNLDRLAHALAP
jgi:hypothetical protein